jgi:acetyltransferase-like isoleucine patch superfamily enzyme
MRPLIRYINPYAWLRRFRCFILTKKVNKPFSPFAIRVGHPFQKVIITKAPSARIVLNGILYLEPYFIGRRDPITIRLGRNSVLTIDGDLIIGSGTSIFIDDEAELFIGGRRKESAAGITEQSRIMVRKKVHIGYDSIIAWNVFITDCDWHTIAGKSFQKDVFIGDHVWIGMNATILKGSRVSNGCIIGAHSLVTGITLPDKCLAAGNPAKIINENVSWRRDMMQTWQPIDFDTAGSRVI